MKTKIFSSVVFLAGVLFFTTGFFSEASAKTNVSFNFGFSGFNLTQRECCDCIVDPYYPYYSERVYARPVRVIRAPVVPVVRERVIVREYPVRREVREVIVQPRRPVGERAVREYVSERPVHIYAGISARAR